MHPPRPGARSVLIVVFLLLGLWLTVHSSSGEETGSQTIPPGSDPGSASGAIELPEVEKGTPVQPSVGLEEDSHLDKAPPRITTGLDLVKIGWSYDCMECHRLLKPIWHRDWPMVEHRDLKLEHGNNRFCLNCHHPENRKAWVDYDGSEIPEEKGTDLCAKCHGPIHRDWKTGVHGRKNGYWDRNRGPQTQLSCIQCHDPHAPAFLAIKPLPPPTYPARAAGKIHPSEADHETSEDPETHG